MTNMEFAAAGIVLFRVVQVVFGALAALLVVAPILANVNVVTAVALWVLALVLLAFAGVVQGVVYWVRRRYR